MKGRNIEITLFSHLDGLAFDFYLEKFEEPDHVKPSASNYSWHSLVGCPARRTTSIV